MLDRFNRFPDVVVRRHLQILEGNGRFGLQSSLYRISNKVWIRRLDFVPDLLKRRFKLLRDAIFRAFWPAWAWSGWEVSGIPPRIGHLSLGQIKKLNP